MTDRQDYIGNLRIILDRHNIPTQHQKVSQALKALQKLKMTDSRSRMNSEPIRLMGDFLDAALSAKEMQLKQAIIECVKAAK